MPGPVVIGLDGRPASRDAIELGTSFCERTRSGLIATFVPGSSHPFTDYDHSAQHALRRQIEGLRREVAPYLERVPPGKRRDLVAYRATTPAIGLRELAGGEAAQLLVVGSGHRTPLGGLLVGTTASHLLSNAPCPVAVAPRGHADNPRQFRAIGVAVDGGRSSEPALRQAARLADELGSELHQLRVEERHIARALSRASEQLDLLVVGCRESGGLAGHPTVGSVSRRLLASSACPLIVVPERLGHPATVAKRTEALP